jgi:Txe/YoeB family toxin of Txe-Axe toxin-antitoxin module
MPVSVLFTEVFYKQLERLKASTQKSFRNKLPVLCNDPHDRTLSTEKLHLQLGSSDVYSCRLNKADRFIWTNEMAPACTLRLIGEHDPTYRRAALMPRVRKEKVRPFKVAFSTPDERLESSPGTHDAGPPEVVESWQNRSSAQDVKEVPSPDFEEPEESEEVFEFSLETFQRGSRLVDGLLSAPPPRVYRPQLQWSCPCLGTVRQREDGIAVAQGLSSGIS